MRARVAVFLMLAGALGAADLKLNDGRILREARVLGIENNVAVIQHAEAIEGIPLAQIPGGALSTLPAGIPQKAEPVKSPTAKAKTPEDQAALELLAVDAELTVVRVVPGGIVVQGEGFVGPARKVGDRVERTPANLAELFFVKIARKLTVGEKLAVRMWPMAGRYAYIHQKKLLELPTYTLDVADLKPAPTSK